MAKTCLPFSGLNVYRDQYHHSDEDELHQSHDQDLFHVVGGVNVCLKSRRNLLRLPHDLYDQLRGVLRTDFSQHILTMSLNGVKTNAQASCDFFAGQSVSDQLQYLAFFRRYHTDFVLV